MSSNISLQDIYRFLNPRDLRPSIARETNSTFETLQDVISKEILDPRGIYRTFNVIKDKIDNFMSKDKSDIEHNIHAIDNFAPITSLESTQTNYWKNVNSITDIAPSLSNALSYNSDFNASVFAIRDPYITPAIHGSDKIDLFLNYTPSHIANQLVPYLDVEFEIRKPVNSQEYMTTPSLHRFLLGARKIDDNSLSPADQAMIRSGMIFKGTLQRDGKTSKSGASIFAGMENFLAPQSLFNYDDTDIYSDGMRTRLTKPRPNVPLASIEDFNVTVRNAGAGAYAHRTASLKMKIHDKSRLSEFSDLIKGPSGFQSVYVWTTYGWIAPRRLGTDDDEYFQFINENMIVRDCWSIIGAPFGFDTSGQAHVTLSLVSHAANSLNSLIIDATPGRVKSVMNDFSLAMQGVRDFINKNSKAPGGLGVSVKQEQFLNSLAVDGSFPLDITNTQIKSTIDNIITSMSRGNIAKDDLNQLEKDIKNLTGKLSKGNILATVAQSVERRLNNISASQTPDPFLNPGEDHDIQIAIQHHVASSRRRNQDIIKKQQAELAKFSVETETAAAKSTRRQVEAKLNSDKNEKNIKNAEERLKYLNDVKSGKISDKSGLTPEEAAKQAKVTGAQLQQYKSLLGANDQPSSPSSDTEKDGKEKKKFKPPPPPPKLTLPTISLNPRNEVISFGKLFLEFVLPEICHGRKADEIQVFFYGLNSNCGPMSGKCIAEFPVAMTPFGHAYAAAMQSASNTGLSLSAFLRLLIDTQFTDKRAIGYGMNMYYKPYDPDKPKEAIQLDGQQADYAEKGMAEWFRKYGSLQIPVIEMYVESGDEGEDELNPVDTLRLGAKNLNLYENRKAGQEGSSRKIIKRIHVYDKSNNPYEFADKVFRASDGTFLVGKLDASKVEKEKIRVKQSSQIYAAINAALKPNKKNKKVPPSAPDASIIKLGIIDDAGISKDLIRVEGPGAVKEQLKRFVPNITIGNNGTMVLTADFNSKVDGLQGAINLIDSVKGASAGKPTLTDNELEQANHLPLLVVPGQVTMTTAGVPNARLYQTYFIDFNTNTTMDNLYVCTQIQHSISQGKFTTNWNFVYTSGYAKYLYPETVSSYISGQLNDEIRAAIGR